MKFSYDILGGEAKITRLPVRHGGTAIATGAVLMKGTSDDTNESFAVIGASALADAIGVIQEPVATTETDSAESTGVHLLKKVIINPLAVYLAEWSQAAADDQTGAVSSSTTFTLASVSAMAGGWIYVSSLGGTTGAAGQLQYIAADGSGTLTTLTAFSPAVISGDTFIKILPQFYKACELNTAATKLASTTAADGTADIVVLENYIEATDIPFQRLDPAKHSGLTGLHNKNVKFYAEITFRNHLLNPLS